MDDISSAPGSRRRGRPRSFDTDAVVERALDAFWANGYELTSLDDLCAATGLAVSSVYAAFGSKRGLFEAALARYETHMNHGLARLERGTSGIDDIIWFVEWVRSGLQASTRPSGCLMVNTMVELAPRDLELAATTARYRDRIRNALHSAMRRAARRGEVPTTGAAVRASLIQAALFGALVTARAGGGDEADAMVRGLVREIKNWRVADRG